MVGDCFFVVVALFKMIVYPAKRHILALKFKEGIKYSQFLFKTEHIALPVYGCYVQVPHYTMGRKCDQTAFAREEPPIQYIDLKHLLA